MRKFRGLVFHGWNLTYWISTATWPTWPRAVFQRSHLQTSQPDVPVYMRTWLDGNPLRRGNGIV